MSAQRVLSLNGNPTALWRMLDRVHRWASLMSWNERDQVLGLMDRTNALVTPEHASAANLHLLEP